MKNKKHFLSILFLGFLTCYSYAGAPDIQEYNKIYRYTLKIKFRKVKPGEDLYHIYYPLPRNNDYQLISNIDTHGGEILDNPDSLDNYVRYTISPEQQTAKGDWGEVMIEFDYMPTSTEYVAEDVDGIYEYDTTSDIYKRYTKKYYDFFDTENETIRKISDALWKDSTDVYDYAEKCYNYVNNNFTFKNNPGMWNSMSDIIKYNGGDCGNLASIIITLLRCKHIPARHVIAYRHAWGEFYLENYGWIPVDPTFKTFGKVVEGYGLIRSHEIVYFLKTSDNKTFRVEYLSKTHVFYPSHESYSCDSEITIKPVSSVITGGLK